MPTLDFQLLQNYLTFKLFSFSPQANGRPVLTFYDDNPTATDLSVDVRGAGIILQMADALGQISARFDLHTAYEHEVSPTEMFNPDAVPDLAIFTIYRWDSAELAHFLPIIHAFQVARNNAEHASPVRFHLPATSSASPAPSHNWSFAPLTRRALADRPGNCPHHSLHLR